MLTEFPDAGCGVPDTFASDRDLCGALQKLPVTFCKNSKMNNHVISFSVVKTAYNSFWVYQNLDNLTYV